MVDHESPRPRVTVARVPCQAHGYVFVPDPQTGPIALVMGVREDNNQRVTSIVDGTWVLAHCGPDGYFQGIDLPREAILGVELHGWPEDWLVNDFEAALTRMFAACLNEGFPFGLIAEQVEYRMAAWNAGMWN